MRVYEGLWGFMGVLEGFLRVPLINGGSDRGFRGVYGGLYEGFMGVFEGIRAPGVKLA